MKTVTPCTLTATNHMDKMNLNTTDALPHEHIKCLTSDESINEPVLKKIEKDLEDYEKISILFLITADDPAQYKQILYLCQNIGDEHSIVTDFVKDELDCWRDQLFEALCIINNKEVLKNLGFSPDDIAQRYQPNISRYTAKIHPALKVLYKLFETMDEQKTKLFLQYIYEEDGLERPGQDNCYLEIHALHWLCAKYITISPGGKGDLSKLLRHLKKMGYYSTLIYHDVEHFSLQPNESDFHSKKSLFYENFGNPGEKISTRENMTNDPGKYFIKKGKCIIINEENFSKEYEKRDGSSEDCKNLWRTFLGMGFEVVEYEDLTSEAIFQELNNNFAKNLHDCLVIVILSHGYEGGIISSDANEILVKDIENFICSSLLCDVIKILIIQACQGKTTGDVSKKSRLALDGPTRKFATNSENILRFGKYVQFMSTMRGFNSIRHKENGSWFIQAVCEVLSNSDGITVSDWMTRVTKNVRGRVGHINNCPSASQLPESTQRLDVEVYFPPYDDERALTKGGN